MNDFKAFEKGFQKEEKRKRRRRGREKGKRGRKKGKREGKKERERNKGKDKWGLWKFNPSVLEQYTVYTPGIYRINPILICRIEELTNNFFLSQFPHHPSYKSNNIHTFSSSSRIPYNPR